jgi:sugar phosphate isomerase/epimerase
MDLRRFSLNSTTVRAAPFHTLLQAAVQHGFGGVGLWRDSYQGLDVTDAARQVAEAGLRVTSVCRGGMFPQATAAGRAERYDDNRRAVDEAHALNADCLVLVCGGAVDKDLTAARQQIEDGIRELLPYAAAARVPLAIEPMHPMMAADRSAITSLTEANDLVQRMGSPWVGVTADSYHLWWDVTLSEQLHRAGRTLFSVQVADWILPIHGQLSSRGMPGEGCIDLAGYVALARSAGYQGLIEVEVLSDRWWAAPVPEAARTAAAGLAALDHRPVPVPS